jgi:ABC-2 type transport system ATP-binding protein
VKQKVLEGDLYASVIKAQSGIKPNQVIRELIEKTELSSFHEKLPSMADIFIGLVQGEDEDALRRHLQEV